MFTQLVDLITLLLTTVDIILLHMIDCHFITIKIMAKTRRSNLKHYRLQIENAFINSTGAVAIHTLVIIVLVGVY